MKNSTLELKLKCNSQNKTIVADLYETHPMRVSRPFRLDSGDLNNRAYIYLRNNSPGLLGEDRLNLTLNLAEKTQLYLTEQSATKVHPMKPGITAKVDYQWNIGRECMVEFVSEPIILYADSELQQTTTIKIHPTASLFLSDIILPGRLARGEFYQFRSCDRRWKIYSDREQLWCQERMYLQGKNNPYGTFQLFASHPVMGSAIAIVPNVEIVLLKDTLDKIENKSIKNLVAAISVLPQDRGVAIKALADKTQTIKDYWNSILMVLRQLNQQALLPHIPK